MKRTGIFCLGIAAISLALSPHEFALTGAAYFITTESIDSAGANAKSANYTLHGSVVGEFGVASTASITSATYVLRHGYVGQLYDLIALPTVSDGNPVTSE